MGNPFAAVAGVVLAALVLAASHWIDRAHAQPTAYLPTQGVGTAVSSGTVTTASTFVTAIGQNAQRRNCTIVNNSANAELVFLGSPGSLNFSQMSALSFPLAAGASWSCFLGGQSRWVATDQVSVGSASASSTFIAAVQ